MLSVLSIRNIILIDRLNLQFGRGLSVLTGETGAGKSILLDAFALALGGRGDASLVRASPGGGDTASLEPPHGQVIAQFDLPAEHPAHALLAEHAIEASVGDVILRRVQQRDGRTKAFINDQPVSVQLLRRMGALLVEIHGQHDDRALTEAGAHRRLLDAYGGLSALADDVEAAWHRWRALEGEIVDHEAALAQARQNADYLRHTLDELEKLAPQPGEEEALAERRQVMMAAEKIAGELDEALASLAGSGGAEERISAALRRLERQPPAARVIAGPVFEALERVLAEAAEARGVIEAALAQTEFSPSELEQAEERLFALRALARKHRVPVDALPSLQEKFTHSLDSLANGEARLAELRAQADSAASDYRARAEELSAKRRAAAARLDATVAGELAPLKLDKARFFTHLEPLVEDAVSANDTPNASAQSGGPRGRERVEFWVQTNPGATPGPMMKIASGGELSRFILALKVVLAERGSAPTLIFDEIDTGIGGATASAIGERLARLGERVQVIAITHAPQVAALASGHLRITKEPVLVNDEEQMVTRVAALDPPGRHEEVARMLAGAVVTDEARAAAKRLIRGRAS